ncbi:sulfotransferase [Acidaminobacter sp. JC074]|uniref:sulfotransferase n=1 Tax=Acidaminobacter sp. JC074 TaxID=2530199 RepID=UPI001F0FB79C|nr:sulfotransferase [Acidaminobacter sp. JC074]MCH4889588.1 sulfotransferase [Acidaminobacter sp. JC074]
MTKRIFISSTGRTGTQFFSKYLKRMIDNSVSLHEPGTPWLSKPDLLKKQLKDYGLYHMTIGQSKNTHSMYKLSRDYLAEEVSKKKAIDNIIQINRQVESLYESENIVYSSGHIYGLLGLLDEIYKDSRFIFIIRDPRTWIESAMNKTEYSLYGPVELIFRNISLKPSCFYDDPYKHCWHKLSKFEKYCWYYSKLNEFVLSDMAEKENFKVFKYEDIFLSNLRTHHFKELLDFASDFESGPVKTSYFPSLLNKKVDSKSNGDAWQSWDVKKAKILHKHCGDLMKKFGYGHEELWMDMVMADD